jgi:hypothetical protein
MSATYLSPEVQLDAGTRTAHAEFEIQNDSQAAWRAAEGFGVGYHVFDAETGTVIVDGTRVRPEGDIKPGESMPVGIDFEVPATR